MSRKAPFSIEIAKARRQKLAALLPPDSAVVLPAWPEQFRNGDMQFNYRCESSLYYLTGFDEPECCLIFRPGKNPETTMFVRPKNIERETWEGFRFGVEGAKTEFGFDQTYDIHEFEKIAPELLGNCRKVYYTLFRNPGFDQIFGRVMLEAIGGWRPKYGKGNLPVEDAYSVVSELRIRKGPDEVELMRKAASISAEAHVAMMKATKPGITERALHGLFLKEVMERGAMGEAYTGIVATGNNATTLHYRFNSDTLRDGQLVLVDCGAEYEYYSGDITRTWPVNGKYSPAQKRIYEKILRVQKGVIDMIKPGLVPFDLQAYTIRNLTEILVEEGVLRGNVDDLIKSQAYVRYYPHGVSHLLGLDTHDVGQLLVNGEPRLIESGWCLTVEPGLYFPENDPNVPQDLRGIGIRIEDDVLVTDTGCEVLTAGVPKDIAEIESIVGKM